MNSSPPATAHPLPPSARLSLPALRPLVDFTYSKRCHCRARCVQAPTLPGLQLNARAVFAEDDLAVAMPQICAEAFDFPAPMSAEYTALRERLLA